MNKDMFDLVIFDEASQLRIEDTLQCLVRGKKKLICGDDKQMPPSDYFAASAEILLD
jgi:superfamily I DNA and/or RNA helicase